MIFRINHYGPFAVVANDNWSVVSNPHRTRWQNDESHRISGKTVVTHEFGTLFCLCLSIHHTKERNLSINRPGNINIQIRRLVEIILTTYQDGRLLPELGRREEIFGKV